eukprot:m.306799 g.306799  ORF g.306799 m.306799 type:complete len:360 (+) comp16354_c0_seq3:221-1300(+)
MEQAKAELEAEVAAPMADGEDPTLWLPDELLLLILEQAALMEGTSIFSLVCQRWWRLCQDRRVQEAEWVERWELYAAGKRKPRSFNFDASLRQLCAGINDTIYCGTLKGDIQVRSANDGWLVQTLAAHHRCVLAMAVDLDCNLYSAAANDNNIGMWSGETGAHIRTLRGHSDMVCSLAVNQVNLFSCSRDGIRVWECSTGDLVHTMTNFKPCQLALGNHGQLYSGHQDGPIRVWSATDYTPLRTLEGHTEAIWALVVDKNDTLFSGSMDCTIRVWSGTDGTLLRTLGSHGDVITSLAVAPNGTLFSTAYDGTIQLWRDDWHKVPGIPYDDHIAPPTLVFTHDGCLWVSNGSPEGHVFKY